MATFSVTGDDVVILDGIGNLQNDLADGDVASITIPNDLANISVGKNGNAIFAKDENGRRADIDVRVLRGSQSDRDLLAIYAATIANFPGLTLMSGQITKKFGDGKGGVSNSYSYFIKGGIMRRAPEMRVNVNGDTEQSVTVYNIACVIDNITVQ